MAHLICYEGFLPLKFLPSKWCGFSGHYSKTRTNNIEYIYIYIYWILLTCALWAHNSISFLKKVLSGIEKAIITDLRMEAKKRKRRFAFIGGNELGIGLGHYEPSTHTIANLLWRVSFMAHLICY